MTFTLTDQTSDFNLEAQCFHVEDNHLAGCAGREGLWFPKQFLITIISSFMFCTLSLVITHTISTTNKLSKKTKFILILTCAFMKVLFGMASTTLSLSLSCQWLGLWPWQPPWSLSWIYLHEDKVSKAACLPDLSACLQLYTQIK